MIFDVAGSALNRSQKIPVLSAPFNKIQVVPGADLRQAAGWLVEHVTPAGNRLSVQRSRYFFPAVFILARMGRVDAFIPV